MSDLQKLMDMGFEKSKIEHAIKISKNEGVKPAMDWLLAHAADKALPRERERGGSSEASTSKKAAVVRSFKCRDCGKIFSNEAEMHFHAKKTNHSNFSETSKEKLPLTAKERQAQLQLVEEILKQKRLERDELERIDTKEREKQRIRTSKDMGEARRKMQELEMKEVIEQRKREKAEDNQAREKVRAQIEADKAERKAREQQKNAQMAKTTTILPSNSTRSASKDYTQTRLQIRLLDGSTLTETFKITDQLSVVRSFVETQIGIDTPFRLMTSFPRKVFEEDDYEKSLEVMGLMPTAVLIVMK